MSDNQSNVDKTLAILFMSLSIILAIICIFNYLDLSEKDQIHLTMMNQLNDKVETAHKDVDLFKNKSERYQQQIKELQESLNTIKNCDGLMSNDIYKYIDTHYRKIPKLLAREIAKTIVSKSKELQISPELVLGVIEVESSFDPTSVSKVKARGLMQVMPEWIPKLNINHVTDLHDIEIGIHAGIQVLKIHIDERKGSVTDGLYYYVGKDRSYVDKVYRSIGKFVSFRKTSDKQIKVTKNK